MAQIKRLVQRMEGVNVSHEPQITPPASTGYELLEVNMGSLTFDIIGLAPGNSVPIPAFAKNSDLNLPEHTPDAFAIWVAPGPHLSGGSYALPILRGLLLLGSKLGSGLEGLRAYGWPPSGKLTAPDIFETEAESWAMGGLFPTSILISLKREVDGGLQSNGLSIFTRQELRLEPDLVDGSDDAGRLALRLVDQLVALGTVEVVEEFAGPDGNTLRLTPSSNGRFVRVSQC